MFRKVVVRYIWKSWMLKLFKKSWMEMIRRELIEKKFRFLARAIVYLERDHFRQGALARFKYNAVYQRNRKYRKELWLECHDYLSYCWLKHPSSNMHFRFVVVYVFLVLFLLYVIYLQTLSTVVVGLV